MAKKFNFSGLDRQFKDSFSTKGSASSGSGSSNRVFKADAFNGVPFLKFEADKTYTIRLVPYEVDKNHPKVQEGKMEPGDFAYVLDYNQHVIGPNKTRVLCPKTYGHSCPVCDKFFALRNEGASQSETSEFKASRRVMYNAVLADDPSKLYIINESHFLFEKEILEELSKGDDEGNPYSIADFCVGCSGESKKALRITVSATKKDKITFNEFQFKAINYRGAVDEGVLDEAIKLHNCLSELKAKELEDIMYGDSSDDEEYEDELEEEDEEEKLVIGRKPAVSDFEEDDVPVLKESKKKPVVEEEEEEEEEETPECPSGYKFGGKSAGLEDECDDCPLFSACRAEKKRRKSLGL